jgi:hypothetical protein
MPEEYLRFLEELGLKEADVQPLITDMEPPERQKLSSLLTDYLSTNALSADEQETGMASRLREVLNPVANANSLIRALDRRLNVYLDSINMPLPAGILATGIYPLNSFRAMAVPRRNGVLLLMSSGCLEFFEYAVSIALMPEPPFLSEKVDLLSNAVKDFVRSSRLPAAATLYRLHNGVNRVYSNKVRRLPGQAVFLH